MAATDEGESAVATLAASRSIGGSAESGVDLLTGRLASVTPLVTGRAVEPAGKGASGQLLAAVAESLLQLPSRDRLWLLLSAMAGAYPTEDELIDAQRSVELARSRAGVAGALLDLAFEVCSRAGSLHGGITVSVGTVLVDTGPSTDTVSSRPPGVYGPRIAGLSGVLPVMWGFANAGFRSVDRGTGETSLLLPWRATVVLADMPPEQALRPLAALAAHSGNRLVALSPSLEPLISAERAAHIHEPEHTVRYLEVLKYAYRVVAMHAPASAQFHAFKTMLRAQGLSGPQVVDNFAPNSQIHTDQDHRVEGPSDGEWQAWAERLRQSLVSEREQDA